MSEKRQKPASVEDAAIQRQIDSDLSETEKQDLIDQVEKFEGPDRREIRGQDSKKTHIPGLSQS